MTDMETDLGNSCPEVDRPMKQIIVQIGRQKAATITDCGSSLGKM